MKPAYKVTLRISGTIEVVVPRGVAATPAQAKKGALTIGRALVASLAAGDDEEDAVAEWSVTCPNNNRIEIMREVQDNPGTFERVTEYEPPKRKAARERMAKRRQRR